MRDTYLLQVIVENFKSYKGKHTIGPFPSFSCVIGPNGAGKSSILDAIAFVLGVPLASMRLETWEDAVHRSCTTAKVSVVILLAGEENLIERTVTRSRQEEPHATAEPNVFVSLNHKPITDEELRCQLLNYNIDLRLKNFLVFQQEVEAFAMKTAKELTDVIDIASGSHELRPMYVAAQQTLEDCNQKLVALLRQKKETSSEVYEFRAQKKEAARFQELNTRASRERTEHALFQLYHLELQLRGKQEALSRSEKKLKEFENQSLRKVENIKEKRKAFAELHKKNLLLLKTARDQATSLREKKTEVEQLTTRLQHMEARKMFLSHELTRRRAQDETQNLEIERVEMEIEQSRSTLEAFKKQCAEEDRLRRETLLPESHLEKMRKLRKEADGITFALRQELNREMLGSSARQESWRRATISLDDTNERLQEAEEQQKLDESRASTIPQELNQAEREMVARTEEYDALQVRFQHAEQIRAEKTEALNSLQDQLNRLRFSRDESRHHHRNTETVRALKTSIRGIYGPLVDLCTIPDPRFSLAVTVAMGKYLEALVVDTRSTALECIRYLKENRIGTMDFIPLDSVVVEARKGGKGVGQREENVQQVIDVLTFESEIEPAVRYVLGQTLLCKTLEQAREMAYGSAGRRRKVVCLDGSLLMKNGALQGGSQSIRDRAKRWDEKKYRELKEKRDYLQNEVYSLTPAAGSQMLGVLNGMEQDMWAAKRKKEILDEEQQELRRKLETHHQALEQLRTQCLQARDEKDRAEQVKASLRDKISRIKMAIQEKEDLIFRPFMQETGVKDFRIVESQDAELTRSREEKRQLLILTLERLQSQLEEEKEKSSAQDVNALAHTAENLTEEIENLQKRLEGLRGEVLVEEQKTQTATQGLGEIRRSLDTTETDLRDFARRESEDLSTLGQQHRKHALEKFQCEKLRTDRRNLFLHCMLDDITLPFTPCSVAETRRWKQSGPFEDPGPLTEEGGTPSNLYTPTRSEPFLVEWVAPDLAHSKARASKETLVRVDYKNLPQRLRTCANVLPEYTAICKEMEQTFKKWGTEMERLIPYVKTDEKFIASEQKLEHLNTDLEKLREKAKQVFADFTKLKEQRMVRFHHTYEKINNAVSQVYQALTEDMEGSGVHGTAYLTLDNHEEPYNFGTRFHATPPMKGITEMELLSGGEKTLASLALLFAMHSIRPAPFIILDEVDAALDQTNVRRLEQYLRTHGSSCQFLVISLKERLFQCSDALFGVYKNRETDTSSILSLDLRRYPR